MVSHHKNHILVVVMFSLIICVISMFDCLCIKNMHVVAFSFGKTALLKYCFFKKICSLFIHHWTLKHGSFNGIQFMYIRSNNYHSTTCAVEHLIAFVVHVWLFELLIVTVVVWFWLLLTFVALCVDSWSFANDRLF